VGGRGNFLFSVKVGTYGCQDDELDEADTNDDVFSQLWVFVSNFPLLECNIQNSAPLQATERFSQKSQASMKSRGRPMIKVVTALMLVSFCSAYLLKFWRTTIEEMLPQGIMARAHGAGPRPIIPAYFNASDLSYFWEAYQRSIQIKPKKLVLVCAVGEGFGFCGGISDRLRGIPYAMGLALLSKRQLVVDSSLMAAGEPPLGLKSFSHVNLVDGNCDRADLEKVTSLALDVVFVTTNCDGFKSSVGLFSTTFALNSSGDDPGVVKVLTEVERECSVPALCGALVAHTHPAWAADMMSAWQFVQRLPMLPARQYTALHIRAGGSTIDVDDHIIKALRWEDGYVSDVPRFWVNAFKTIKFGNCPSPIAVISDSIRLVAELQFQAYDRLLIERCCTQPLHRDRTHRPGFFWQEALDLFVLARASQIIGSHGGFVVLGQYWMGKREHYPELIIAISEDEIQGALTMILRNAGCQEM